MPIVPSNCKELNKYRLRLSFDLLTMEPVRPSIVDSGSCNAAETSAMNHLVPTNRHKLSRPTCPDCGAPMRLFGIEAHPTLGRTDLRTYVCSYCDEVQTENVPLLRH